MPRKPKSEKSTTIAEVTVKLTSDEIGLLADCILKREVQVQQKVYVLTPSDLLAKNIVMAISQKVEAAKHFSRRMS